MAIDVTMLTDPDQVARDVTALVDTLLAHSETRGIIDGTHLGRNLTEDEHNALHQFCYKSGHLDAFDPLDEPMTGGLHNAYVAIGVARRIVAKELAQPASPEAQHQIRENIVHLYDNLGAWCQVHQRNMARPDFERVFNEYIVHPDLPRLIDEWNHALSHEDSASEQAGATRVPAFKIMVRYGWLRGVRFEQLASVVFHQGLDRQNSSTIDSVVAFNNSQKRDYYPEIVEVA